MRSAASSCSTTASASINFSGARFSRPSRSPASAARRASTYLSLFRERTVALQAWLEMQPPGPAHAMDWPGTHAIGLASVGAAQSHGPKPVPPLLHTWLLEHPPGPVHDTEAPGVQAIVPASIGVVASPEGAQAQGPKPVPSLLQTWLVEHPPGPVHATERPGTHAIATEASVDASAPLASEASLATLAPQPTATWAAASVTRAEIELPLLPTERG